MTSYPTHLTRHIVLILGICASFFASCSKTSAPTTTISVTSISLDASYVELEVGESYTLTATISPHDSDNQKIIWSTDNAKIATVESGVVTALKAGTANITVKSDDGGHIAACKVRVTKPRGNDTVPDEEPGNDTGKEDGEKDDETEGDIETEPDIPAEKSKIVTYVIEIPSFVETTVNELIYEIYQTDEPYAESFGENDQLISRNSIEIISKRATIEFEISENQNYTVLFWAQVADNGVYDVASLTEVKIPTIMPSNTHNTESFAGRSHIVSESYESYYEVKLDRIASELIIRITPELQTAYKLMYKSCSMDISYLSTSFDVARMNAKADTSEKIRLEEGALIEEQDDDYIIISRGFVGFADKNGNTTCTRIGFLYDGGEENIEWGSMPIKPGCTIKILIKPEGYSATILYWTGGDTK